MISPLRLEQDGHWRSAGLAICFLPVFAVVTMLLGRALLSASGAWPDASFVSALGGSLRMALAVGAIALGLGLPTGVMAALYRFPGRTWLLTLVMLPILAPSFLWAIGWSALASRWSTATGLLEGIPGLVLAHAGVATPIVALTTFAAAGSLTASQVDAVRVSNGETAVVWHAARHVAPPAALATVLVAVLMLSDPGPGMIFGVRTVAGDLLNSFSSQYDFLLAARQSLGLAAVVVVLTVPILAVATPRLADAILARQLRPLQPVPRRLPGSIAAAMLALVIVGGLLAPLTGLLLPLRPGASLQLATETLARTGMDTLLYAFGAGVLATALGFAVALCAGRTPRLRIVTLVLALVVLVQPPALLALGVVELAASAPASADPVLRGPLVVCVTLALRLFPLAVLLGLRAWGGLAPSWAQAAAVHGVPLSRYLGRVAAPLLAPSALASVLLVALLASADVSTVLLLHPPGHPSLPLTIFTVMANAPEAWTAALCLIYVLAVMAVLGMVRFGLGRWSR